MAASKKRKAGKPDKRYIPSTHSRSKVTKKAPVKRTIKRRSKRQIKGYSANPAPDHVIKVVTKTGMTGWFAGVGNRGTRFDTIPTQAKKMSKSVATDIANLLRHKYGKSVREIRVIKK